MRLLPIVVFAALTACASAGSDEEVGDGAASDASVQSVPAEPVPTGVETSSSTSSTTVAVRPESAAPVIFRSPALDRDATSLPILFMERACTTGNRADGRFELIVVEDESTIDVSVRVTPPQGDQGCPGNPWTPAIVELAGPVGDRRIVGVTDPLDHSEMLGGRPGESVQVVAQTVVEMPDAEFVEALRQFDGEVQCEDVGLEIGFEFFMVDDRLGREDVLAEALLTIGGPYDRMFRVRDPSGSATIAQFLDGTAVGSVDVYRGELGWLAFGYRCGDLPDDWIPDSDLPEPEGRVRPVSPAGLADDADVADAKAIIGAVEGVEDLVDGLTFADPAERCPALIEIESALESVGWHFFGSQLWLDPNTGPGAITVDRHTDTLMIHDDGRTLWLRTRSGGLIDVQAADQGVSQGPTPLTSYVGPCLLDIPLRIDVLDPAT